MKSRGRVYSIEDNIVSLPGPDGKRLQRPHGCLSGHAEMEYFVQNPDAVRFTGSCLCFTITPDSPPVEVGDWIDVEWGDNGDGYVGWTLVEED